MGALRVSGSTCTGDGTIATGSKTDQCFNSSGTTQAVFGTSDEGFGMTSSSVDTTNGTTTNLVRDTEYDGDGTNGDGDQKSKAGATLAPHGDFTRTKVGSHTRNGCQGNQQKTE
jgi:hypothetical protein